MNEEDILANLEESLEQHNYETAGFVSSYALPLSHDTTTSNEELVLSQPIKFTRAVESFESANNSSVGTNDDDIDNVQDNLSDIFRSPSNSPKARTRTNSSTYAANDNDGVTFSPPEDTMMTSPNDKSVNISINSDSTDGVSNITSSLFSPPPNNLNGNWTPKTPAIGEVNVVRDVAGISPLRYSPDEHQKKSQSNNNTKSTTKKKKRKKNTTNTPKVKKNNLVIQPSTPWSNTSKHTSIRNIRSDKKLPPTHPLSPTNNNTTKNTSPPRVMLHRSSHSMNSIHSEASSACGSAASEATPVITPSNYRNHTFSFSDDDDEEEESGGNTGKDGSRGAAELQGVNISFTQDSVDNDGDEAEESDDNDQEDRILSQHTQPQEEESNLFSSPPPTMSNAAGMSFHTSWIEESSGSSKSQQQQYKGDNFFTSPSAESIKSNATKATHKRQFSSDENFFDAVYNSGLQSTSFDVLSDASFVDDASIESLEDEKSVCSIEERKAMEERIIQWRKGRELWRRQNGIDNGSATPPRNNNDDGHDQQQEEEVDDEGYCDVELAPLSSKKVVSNAMKNIHNAGGGEQLENRVGEINLHDQIGSPSKSNIGWGWRSPIVAIRNAIWRLSRHPHSFEYTAVAPTDSNGMTNPRTFARRDTWRAENLTPQKIRFADNNNYVNDDDEGNESAALTPSKMKLHNQKKRSLHYDDVDFNRSNGICSCCWDIDNYRYTDGSGNAGGETSQLLSSRWKKLLFISALFLLLAWIFTNGNLEKHIDNMSYDYGISENDPLGRDDFEERIRIIDDGDDYYWSDMLGSPVDDDDDFHSQLFSRHRQDPSQYYELEEDTPTPVDNVEDNHHETAIEYNNYSGIDTIVVLALDSIHPTFSEWIVDRLKKLYPDMNVITAFPRDTADSPKQRGLKIYDPTSDKSDVTPKSNHILVLSIFINVYDWIEMMRVDAHNPKYIPNNHARDELKWMEYIETTLYHDMTILDFRAEEIRTAIKESAKHDGVKLVIQFQYEDLVEPYSNFDNYVRTEGLDQTSSLPGIVGLLDEIQARTGLHPDESSGWREPSETVNEFWADPIGCSDLSQMCFPTIDEIRHDPEYIQYINDNADWAAERLVGYQMRSLPKPRIEEIVILGERHSGAEWLVDRLARCFPTTQVKYGLQNRPGKFFQKDPNDESIPQTLVISTFLNPFDWVELMRQQPINAPSHKEMEWSDFITSPWERKRSNLDLALTNTSHANCSYGFSFNEIIPCMTKRDPTSDTFPLYELHPPSSGFLAGDSYASILSLRADKIRNFLSVANFEGVVDFIHMRYEDLIWDGHTSDTSLPFPGIAGLLEKIRDQTSLIPNPTAGWISDGEGFFKAKPLGVGTTELDPYYLQYMNEHVDWEVELLVGYQPY